MSEHSTVKMHEPLFHISKRSEADLLQNMIVRGVAILIGFIICAIFVTASADGSKSFFDVFASLFSGAFGTERRIWILLREMSILLGVALALSVSFRMKFWNLGGNGQILMGCLACTICMYYLGDKVPYPLLIIIELVASLAAGAIWALIPALFKAFFKTNESLFTLMMNYIASLLVAFFISYWVPNGSGTLNPFEDSVTLPDIYNRHLLSIIVVTLLTVGMFLYLKYSKQGYEISVVGESENTARYIGINVKAVVIRTLILSGALCGLVGLLLSGSINHTMSTTMDGNMGFTGIMVAWLGKFNPIMMILTSFFITFINRGMSQVCTDFGFTSTALSEIIIGLIYFLVIGCEFFISYKIHFRSDLKELFLKPFKKEAK